MYLVFYLNTNVWVFDTTLQTLARHTSWSQRHTVSAVCRWLQEVCLASVIRRQGQMTLAVKVFVRQTPMLGNVSDINSPASDDTQPPSTVTVRLRVSDGDELRRVQLPNYKNLYHAVESPTGTFVVSLCNTQLRQHQVVEVNTGGEVQRQFSGLPLLPLGWTPHVAVDSHGNILVADASNRHILLLDAHLSLRRVIIDEHQLNYEQPWRLCYREQSGQLLVGLYFDIVAFDALCC